VQTQNCWVMPRAVGVPANSVRGHQERLISPINSHSLINNQIQPNFGLFFVCATTVFAMFRSNCCVAQSCVVGLEGL
jgi:hypothetical protein